MKMYLLYVSYPCESGYVYGVYSTREEAERYMKDENYEISTYHAIIKEVVVDEFIQIMI
jgi:hypothetical protein